MSLFSFRTIQTYLCGLCQSTEVSFRDLLDVIAGLCMYGDPMAWMWLGISWEFPLSFSLQLFIATEGSDLLANTCIIMPLSVYGLRINCLNGKISILWSNLDQGFLVFVCMWFICPSKNHFDVCFTYESSTVDKLQYSINLIKNLVLT